jgi:hypothetical protein
VTKTDYPNWLSHVTKTDGLFQFSAQAHPVETCTQLYIFTNLIIIHFDFCHVCASAAGCVFASL